MTGTIRDIDPAFVKLEGMMARRLGTPRRGNPYAASDDPRHWVWALGWLTPDLKPRPRRTRRASSPRASVRASRETLDVSRGGVGWLLSEDLALIWTAGINGWSSTALAPAFRRSRDATRKHAARLILEDAA